MISRPHEQIAVDRRDLRRLAVAGSSTVTSELFELGLRNVVLGGTRQMSGSGSVAALAVTVRCVPGREDCTDVTRMRSSEYPMRQAIERVGPDRVLLIEAGSHGDFAVIGGLLSARVRARGGLGVVTDGYVRDLAELDTTFQVFAAGTHPAPPVGGLEAIAVDAPVACGGVAVYPGDVVVGDEDGIVCVPAQCVQFIADKAWQRAEFERFALDRLQGGHALEGPYPPDGETEHAFRTSRAR